jgi:N-acetylglucosaminyl-diphospho-decaprenol L-rhamnosyltransferase
MEHRDGDGRVAVVIVTKDRCAGLLETLARLQELPERPLVTVVDNASTDETPEAVAALAERDASVRLMRLPRNLGAAGRNCGVAVTPSPYVAFSDDDSWWAPRALETAADLLDAHPQVGLLAGRVLVGEAGKLDPTCAAMEVSPVRPTPGPGRSVLGFVACGAVVRRQAFLEVGGFRLGYGVGGEEEVFAIDMAAAGWSLSYSSSVTAHHHPSAARDPAEGRRRLQARNALRTAWLRRRPVGALRRTIQVARGAVGDRAALLGMADAAGDLVWIWHERAPVAASLEADLTRLWRAPGVLPGGAGGCRNPRPIGSRAGAAREL